MSGIWQASVTHHSKLPEPLRHLLYLLADAANDAGIIDPAPNQETLATMTGCSSRTVRTRMAAIVQSGELEQTRVGAGPGNPSAYKFMLPLPPNMKAENKPEKGGNGFRLDRLENELAQHALRISSLEARMTSVEQQLAALTTAVTELTAMIKAEKGGNNHVIISAFVDANEETKPEKGGNETGKRRKENRKKVEMKPENTGNETGKYRKGPVLNTSDDPILIHSDPSVILNAPAPVPEPGYTFTSEAAERFNGQFEAMVAALEGVTHSHRALIGGKLESAAINLLHAGYSAPQITAAFGHGGWWYVTGFGKKDGAPPQLGNILNDIGKAAKGNGHSRKPAQEATPAAVEEDWSTAPAPLPY